MRNPELTKNKILKKSSLLFNTKGYKATSISDITTATGFTKGAVYRHFKNKEDLEKESLNYLSAIMLEKVRTVVKEQKTAGDKLRAVFKYFESYVTQPPVKGGCPLLNAAIEADDAYPALKKEALKVLETLKSSIVIIIGNGIRYKQIKEDVDADFYATLIVASLEGGIMMSKLSGNNKDILKITDHLKIQIKSIEI